jgi:hypothetical protein
MHKRSLFGVVPPSSSAGGIAIRIVFLTPLNLDDGDLLRFQVSLDTHFGNLMKFDLAEAAELRIDGGSPIRLGFEWEPASVSSHHRSGVLRLDYKTDGQALLFGTGPGSIEHVLKEIAVPTRTFAWAWEEWDMYSNAPDSPGTQA